MDLFLVDPFQRIHVFSSMDFSVCQLVFHLIQFIVEWTQFFVELCFGFTQNNAFLFIIRSQVVV